MLENPMAISLDEMIEFRTKIFNRTIETAKKKGADYNRDQQKSGNSLFNLSVCELMGIVPTAETGILVRLGDKFMRLISLARDCRVTPEVTDESVLDTIEDIHNYVDYLAMLYLKRKAVLAEIEAGAPTVHEA